MASDYAEPNGIKPEDTEMIDANMATNERIPMTAAPHIQTTTEISPASPMTPLAQNPIHGALQTYSESHDGDIAEPAPTPNHTFTPAPIPQSQLQHTFSSAPNSSQAQGLSPAPASSNVPAPTQSHSPARGSTPTINNVGTGLHPNLPASAIIPPGPNYQHGSPTRVYLNQKVVPVLLEGMKYLAKNEPEKPLKWLSEYLANQSAKVEGP